MAGSPQVAEAFSSWFAGADDYEPVDAYEFISEQARDASATYGVKSISLLATKTAD